MNFFLLNRKVFVKLLKVGLHDRFRPLKGLGIYANLLELDYTLWRIKKMSNQNYLNWAVNLQNEFATMSIKDQILVFALTVAITVLALTITYWAVKGSLYLTYYSVKLSLYLTYYSVVLSLLIPYGIIKIISRSSKEVKLSDVVNTVQPAIESIPKTQFCSECGTTYSQAMEKSLSSNGNCFCENCGLKTEIRV